MPVRLRYLHLVLLGLAVLLLPGTAASADPGVDQAAAYAPHQALVRFAEGVSLATATRATIRREATVARALPKMRSEGRILVVRSASLSTKELVAVFKADPHVDVAEPDYILHIDATPNDPGFSSLWGMQQIRATGAWDLTTGSSSVVVADIDTGVDYSHADLAGNMWTNPGEIAGNGVDDDGNSYIDDVYGIDRSAYDSDPMDENGHGTHTSGTVAAVGNNAVGVTGVAWTAKIMALRFLDSSGSGYTSNAITCVDYATAEKQSGVNVVAINPSWGGGSYSSLLLDAISNAGAAGIVFVASAGNGGTDGIGDDNDITPQYPACYSCTNVITVAATDSSDALATFSNYGATSVDLSAPGVGIHSTMLPTSPEWPYSYYTLQGTSMAAPHVTGAIALCAALYPGETVAQRIGRILTSADPSSDLTGKCVTGGRLDAWGALDSEGPVTTATGIDDSWHNSAVDVVFSAVDPSGVASVEYSLDGAAPVQGTTCTVTGDGSHSLSYHAIDNAGNAENAKAGTVNVDTGHPVTTAVAKVSVKKGHKATMRFSAADTTPAAVFLIKIYKGRKQVKSLKVGQRPTNATQKYSWKCKLAVGRYTWKVYATDLAGNTQVKPAAKALVVGR